jgi:hypothetical protein
MAKGKKRTSFMKLTRDRELAEKRELKRAKRAARKADGQLPGAAGTPESPTE